MKIQILDISDVGEEFMVLQTDPIGYRTILGMLVPDVNGLEGAWLHWGPMDEHWQESTSQDGAVQALKDQQEAQE